MKKIIQQYVNKTYHELLVLPEHFQLDLPELQAQHQTIEFVRIYCEDDTLEIVFKHVYWQTPEKTLEKYTQQFLMMGLTPKGAEKKAAKTLEKVLKEGLDTSGKGLPKSAIAAMQQMKEEHPEFSFPHIPPKHVCNLIFDHCSFDGFFIKRDDGSCITRQEKIEEIMRREESTIETASWFGKTGLGEETERALSRYLRLEFGETLEDDGALKASDLKYLGVFNLTEKDFEAENATFDHSAVCVHIWQIGNRKEYAYIHILRDKSSVMHMGTYLPQKANSLKHL